MRSFFIPSPKLLYKIFLCAIIILIRKLIDHLIIHNQLNVDNFTLVIVANYQTKVYDVLCDKFSFFSSYDIQNDQTYVE